MHMYAPATKAAALTVFKV